MPRPTKVFLDASALVAGIWSAEGGARMILKLGEATVIELTVSRQVLTETENALRRKKPEALALAAVLIDRARAAIVPEPTPESVQRSLVLTSHTGDAQVLAAAWDAGVDYFVTLDRAHFLDNPALAGAVPFPVGTPGDFLGWYRDQLRALEAE
jgi:predicted nucleic acid-binding protein